MRPKKSSQRIHICMAVKSNRDKINPMTRWIEPENVMVPPDLERAVGGDPIVAELLVRRGIQKAGEAHAFLDPDNYLPTSASALPDLNRGVDVLEEAIQAGKSICVWGDFDVDGQTATTVLVSTLQDLGGKVSFHIPVRARESHGVNLRVLEDLIAGGIDVLLTCDTGIAAHDAVDYAQKNGVKVVITDHHDLPPSLPAAEAVINPKRLPAGHALSTLPGVGVAYKLAEALFQRAGRAEAVEASLDLVALGIVADLAIQRGDARYLLQRGLAALRRTNRIGLLEMMQLAGLNPSWLTEEHIGFVLGPRLNALGRLDDANLAVEFLSTSDLTRARILAQQLEGLNAQRKLLTDQVFSGAQAQLARDPTLLDHAALVLAHPSWPAGVIGIVASRLVEAYHKPTILITSPPGEPARGSARSIEGVDISAAIAAQATLLQGYGGHPMAAGLSLDPEQIAPFRTALSKSVAELLGDEQLEPTLRIDGYLPLEELSLDLVQDLERLAPFGPGNPPLTFASRDLTIKSAGALGRSGEHRQVIVEDQSEFLQKVVWWRSEGLPLPAGQFDLAYSVRISTYQGQRELQITWTEAREQETPDLDLPSERRALEVVDHRGETHPLPVLQALSAKGPLQVWSEAEARDKLQGQHRGELEAGVALAIWTIPPGPQELQNIMDKVSPFTLYLFAIDPGMDHPEPFLKRLAGLVKHATREKVGDTSLEALAAATAQRVRTVELGLAWLEASGKIVISTQEGETITLSPGTGRASTDQKIIWEELQDLLAETVAFRDFYRSADANRIVTD
jgi:single-stranded-DNA-specific exonuclease